MMNNELRPYEKYEKIGLVGLEYIPKHWRFLRIKHIFREINIKTEVGTEDLLSVSQYTGVTLRKNRDLIGKGILTNAESLVGYKYVEKNDLVMNIMLAWNGSLGISKYNGIVSPAYCVYRLIEKSYNPVYFHYLFRTPQYTGLFSTLSTGVIKSRLRLYPEDFFRLNTIVPLKEEQDKIVKYLDYKLVKINKFIKAKKKLIAVLKEQKQAIINQAVTKGLDPNVKLKPSGIEWLGDVPEHWEVHAIKWLLSTKMTDGPHETPEFTDSGIPFVSADAVKDGRILFERMRGYISEETHQKYTIKVKPQKNDIFIVKSGSTTGKACIVDFDEEFSIWSPLALVRTNSLNDPYYVYYSICSSYFKKQVENKWSFGTQPNIGMGILQNLFIAVPSLDEQLKIADIVKSKTVKVDAIIKRITSELDYINEYKNSIISNVVTGKVDVRNVIIDESENDIEEIVDLEDENVEADEFIDEGGDE